MARKKWVPLTEEEKVRQFLIHYLIEEKKTPLSHLSVEKQITVDGMTKRYDLVVYHSSGSPMLVIECKAPHIVLSQNVVEQVGRYNKTLRAPVIGVSNGQNSIFFHIDFETEKIQYIDGWPDLSH